MTSQSLAVEIIGVSKSYKGREVVKSLTTSVAKGTFFSIVGPSGCGKTTTLRMLGGFVRPDVGEIRLSGQEVSSVPPHKRNVNTVFQSYALFGHLNVADNVAFGLKRKKVPADEVRTRVRNMLQVVSLEDRANAFPKELSGGQQQRVALGRALVNTPDILLLDEPLGALDLRLRRQMQLELKHIQKEVGVAFVYVTHDQEEALTMSDVIAVMNEGVLLQTGTPEQVYNTPQNLFVAEFIGSTNTLTGQVKKNYLELDCGASLTQSPSIAANVHEGDLVSVCVRPNVVSIHPIDDPDRASTETSVRGRIVESVFMGTDINHQVLTESGQTVTALIPAQARSAKDVRVGDDVEVGWHVDDCQIFRASDGWLIGSPQPDTASEALPNTSQGA